MSKYISTMCVLALVLTFTTAVRTADAQSTALYFPATGHHLTDDTGFLSFWQAHNGERLLGFPITEAFDAGGQTVQYFERGRIEQVVDPATGSTSVQTGRVGAEYAGALWRQFPAEPPPKARPGVQVFDNGHSLRGAFLQFWHTNGGLDFFGAPISAAIWEMTAHGQRRVQYFERGRLERDADRAGTPDEVVVSDLGRALALLQGLDTAPVANWGAEPYGPPAPPVSDITALDLPLLPEPVATASPPPAVPAVPPAPAAPAPPPPATISRTAHKSIVVNLSDQWLYAYEDGVQVFDAPVATGRDGMNTPAGNFAIYAKLKSQTMDGVTDGVPWVVPDVPHVMYIYGGVALHGTYWHNLFGTGARPSHGCINLPLKAAAWLYDWAPVGTPVTVSY